MSQLPEGQDLTPSLLFIYFMFGFIIGLALTMIALSVLRPFLPPNAVWVKALVIAPLAGGALIGSRVIAVARPSRLRLGAAVKAALFGQR